MRATYKTDECTPKLPEELGRCIEGRLRYANSFISNLYADHEIILRKPLKYRVCDLCYMTMIDDSFLRLNVTFHVNVISLFCFFDNINQNPCARRSFITV